MERGTWPEADVVIPSLYLLFIAYPIAFEQLRHWSGRSFLPTFPFKLRLIPLVPQCRARVWHSSVLASVCCVASCFRTMRVTTPSSTDFHIPQTPAHLPKRVFYPCSSEPFSSLLVSLFSHGRQHLESIGSCQYCSARSSAQDTS